jgi:ABC-2 type transport system permease protein
MKSLRIHLLEIKYELLKALRMPAYSLPTILFPLVFYVFFGLVFGSRSSGNGFHMALYLIATYGCFGVIGASLFGMGVTVAVERGQGWLQVKRTTPMPVSAYFGAKVAMAMVFSAAIVLGLFALGISFGNVHLTIAQALKLLGVLVAGSLTFCALGLAIGYFAGPNSAAPIANLIYLPTAFLSGLWIPIFMLPKPLQMLAYFLPPFHLSQIALDILGAGRGGSMLGHVAALLIATILFLAIAYAGWRRDEGKTYG